MSEAARFAATSRARLSNDVSRLLEKAAKRLSRPAAKTTMAMMTSTSVNPSSSPHSLVITSPFRHSDHLQLGRGLGGLQQIRNSNRLIAMRAEPTHADPAAGPHASDAPLFAEVAGLAFTALIDGVVPAGPGRRDRARFGLGGGVPAAPRCSTTGVAAVALPADPRKRRPADRAAARSRCRRHVVPRRDLRHRRPPGWRCAPPPGRPAG